jgi:hypothetical protein
MGLNSAHAFHAQVTSRQLAQAQISELDRRAFRFQAEMCAACEQEAERQWYIAAFNPVLDGIRIARLLWAGRGGAARGAQHCVWEFVERAGSARGE